MVKCSENILNKPVKHTGVLSWVTANIFTIAKKLNPVAILVSEMTSVSSTEKYHLPPDQIQLGLQHQAFENE